MKQNGSHKVKDHIHTIGPSIQGYELYVNIVRARKKERRKEKKKLHRWKLHGCFIDINNLLMKLHLSFSL